jgi:CheY-like chemotaxis protein
MKDSPQTIWVIDDDTAVLEAVSTILKDEGYEVLLINDPLTVKSTIENENPPQLIFLDILMAGMDGQEVAQLVKNSEKTKQVPIVMLSANIQVEEIAKKSHADGFLKKPFNIEELIQVTRKYIASK